MACALTSGLVNKVFDNFSKLLISQFPDFIASVTFLVAVYWRRASVRISLATALKGLVVLVVPGILAISIATSKGDSLPSSDALTLGGRLFVINLARRAAIVSILIRSSGQPLIQASSTVCPMLLAIVTN